MNAAVQMLLLMPRLSRYSPSELGRLPDPAARMSPAAALERAMNSLERNSIPSQGLDPWGRQASGPSYPEDDIRAPSDSPLSVGSSSKRPGVLLQSQSLAGDASSYEVRAASQAAMLLDLEISRCRAEALGNFAAGLSAGTLLPVGSVEFVREAMRHAGVAEPRFETYPRALHPYMLRTFQKATAADLGKLRTDTFVKPVDDVKRFNGLVLPRSGGADRTAAMDEHDREQLVAIAQLAQLAPSTPVWLVEPVAFQSEWRFYFSGAGELLASARYDDGADEAKAPDPLVVRRMGLAYAEAQSTSAQARTDAPASPFALDIGVLDSTPASPNDPRAGLTALIEANGCWALGYYSWAETPEGKRWPAVDYLQFLRDGWQAILGRPQAPTLAEQPQADDPDTSEASAAPRP